MPSDPRPNILLITTDQQRWDTLACYGNPHVRSPHLDALAARGTRFETAIVQNPVCIPSRACFQTGRYTHQHGVQYMESVIDDTPGLPKDELTIMERLQHAGYRTGGFGKIHMMPERGFHEQQVTGGKGQRWTRSAGLPVGLAPLGRDYAAWLEERDPGAYERIYEQRRDPEYRRDKGTISNVLPLDNYVEWWTMENTVEFVQRQQHNRPFFAWCGFCGPHGPVDPPAPYDTLYPQADVPLPPNYAVTEFGEFRPTTDEQDRIARKFVAGYWGLVTLIDDMIGRIVHALDTAGVLDNTLVVFTSDHGEMGFDFGRLGKGNFYEPVIRVPLIVVPPGAAASGGRIVPGLVECFDLAPTVLDYARAEIPENMSGTTLRPLIEGDGEARPVALCEYLSNDRSKSGICLRTPHAKYVQWTDGTEKFFDLEQDPLERSNLIGDPTRQPEITEHRRLLIQRLATTGRGVRPRDRP